MSFQILNSNNEPIKINDLDVEAAQLWNKEVDAESYANPEPLTGDRFKDAMNNSYNWFDIIGHNIHSCDANYHKRYDDIITWKMVKESIALNVTNILDILDKVKFGPYTEQDDNNVLIAIGGIKFFCKPYFKLIDMWESKGYTPKKVD